MRNTITNAVRIAAVVSIALMGACESIAQVVERERPAEWANLVRGGRFMDRFEPSKAIAPLTSDCWGADGVKPRDVKNGIEDAKHSYWGGNIRRDDKGKYHLFVARWPENSKDGHFYWAQSDVCHAVSDSKEGPFVPIEVLGKGHNPEVFRCADGSWCIYVIWGCFRAPTLNGPWKRDGQLPMVGTDGKWTGDDSNFSFCERDDGSVLAISRHGHLWISPDGIQPFAKKSDKSIYPNIDIDTFEDPVIWKDHVQYNVIVNDWKGRIAYHLVSPDGVSWETRPGEAYTPGIAVVDTDSGPVTNNWFKYERMKVFQDEYGRAVQANFAVIDVAKWEDKASDAHSSKNITIPLNPGRLLELLPRKSAADACRVRIRAEKGFNPIADIDRKSLRFGLPDEVSMGGGVAPKGFSPDGDNLVVEFPAVALSGPFAKLLGREKCGRLLFGEMRVNETSTVSNSGRVVEDFNDGWEFSRDRQNWRAVSVPHDWAIEGPFHPQGDASTAKLPWSGTGWYRKTLNLPMPPEGRRIFLDFDGIMCDGTVYVNDQPCGHRAYGYLGMRVDITPYVFRGENTVLVKADTTKLISRWYPGAGLYRRVRKIETDELYMDQDDIVVATPDASAAKATVEVRGKVTSRRVKDEPARIVVALKAPNGKIVAKRELSLTVPACGKGGFAASFDVKNPELWQMEDDAKLYTVAVGMKGEMAKDVVAVRTGIRSFRFDGDRGFFLNGEHVQLKGANLHSDLGILGMAFNKSAMRRQLRVMKDMGVNAIRTSHNPPAPEMLDLCDEMGLFVWDECFDKWNWTAGRKDEPLEQFVEENLKDHVRRDRNHPCVFVWSIGNEIPPGGGFESRKDEWAHSPAHGTTAERCTRFRNAVRSVDATRAVGIGCCHEKSATRGDFVNLDITGWNYRRSYQDVKKTHPDKPVLYSESASAVSEYGFYADRLPTNRIDFAVKEIGIDSYDRNAADWCDIADIEFERLEKDAYVCGEFVWTGIDYLGEPTPYGGWSCPESVRKAGEARSSYFGACDLLALPKDRFYLYRSYWNKKDFTLHVVPDNWTFPERVGKVLPVYVYTSAEEAELFVNGVSQGRRRKDPNASADNGYYAVLPRYRLVWDNVVYQPGEVKVVAYGKDGKKLGEETLRTAGAAKKVVLTPESTTLPEDGKAFVFVKVTLADEKGTQIPRDNRRVSFKVDGPAEIVAVGNSDPRGLDSFKDTSSHPLCHGRAGLFLRRTGKGKVILCASADGVDAGRAEFD